jgi:hypothetical protein
MTNNTQDPKKFKHEWDAHVDALRLLSHTLPPHYRRDLDDTINRLHQLVDVATDTLHIKAQPPSSGNGGS